MSNDAMSQAEIDHGRETFLKYDEDQSGTIDDDELENILRDMGFWKSAEETLRLTSQVCERPGAVIFSEFLDLMKLLKANAATQEDENDMADCFVYLGGSPDKKGNLDKARLNSILKNLVFLLTKNQ